MAKTASGVRTDGAIRKAAVKLLYERGYHGMNLRDLAAAVGIQAGSLYNHFPSKQALLHTLLRANMDEMVAGLDTALAGAATPPERMAAFVRFHIQFHTGRRETTFICNMELRNLSRANHRAIVRQRDAYQARVEAIVAAGIAAGKFRVADSKVVAFGVLAMLTGVCNWYRPGGRLSTAAIADAYIPFILAGLRDGSLPARDSRARHTRGIDNKTNVR